MQLLGVGFSLHADSEFLALARPLIEERADFFEVNPETLWRPEGERLVRNAYHELFRQIRDASGKPFVAHGLGFSLGSGLNERGERARVAAWLERLADDQAAFDFVWLSEHLGWTQRHGRQAVLPLPLPFTREAVERVAARLRRLEEVVPLVAIENSANYFLTDPPADEPAFLAAILAATPCRLLLDLHNVHAQALNLGFDPFDYVDHLDLSAVLEIHVSGGSESEADWLRSQRTLRLDSHDGAVPERVWDLLAHVLPRCTGLRGVVVERLNGTFGPDDLPALAAELDRARALLPRAGTAGEPRPRAPARSLPAGGDLDPLQDWLVEVLNGPDPGRQLDSPPDALLPATRAALAALDRDGFVLTGLLVRKLRFERLCRGDRRVEASFAAAPEAFAARFASYAAEVAPTAWFPLQEAALFHDWIGDQEA